jgi:glycosyltransferase involved in cell wall biosynthesis
MRVAWFSPVPPVPVGPATDSAALIAALRGDHEIEVYVDEPVARVAPGTRSAHDFVWRQRQHPFDLTIYQLGNSSHHDYIWPYLFRYPGLTVVHDAHLHHARAAALLRTRRADDYRAELTWNHPEAAPDRAELAIKGFDSFLHYDWPMTRAVVEASRLVAVHSPVVAARLREESPDACIESIRLGHGTLLSPSRVDALRAQTRARYGISQDAVVFGCFGGLTLDKRLPQILDAFADTRRFVPQAHLLCAGAISPLYDLNGEIRRRGLETCATVTGYLAQEEDLTACIAAADVALNLRWPTAREISGPWLRALAAGKATVIIDLSHLVDVPTIDPRTWVPNERVLHGSSEDRGLEEPGGRRFGASGDRTPHHGEDVRALSELPRPRSPHPSSPCSIAIDILDEDHSLRLAMRRLATDASLRATLGDAARAYWIAHHAIDAMADDYRRLIARAVTVDDPRPALPPHLINDGMGRLHAILEPFGLSSPLGGGRLDHSR